MWITESANKGRKMNDMYRVSGIDVYIKDNKRSYGWNFG